MTAAHLHDFDEQPKAERLALTDAEYFKAYRDYMTSHKLEDFRASPLLFKAKHIDGTIKPPESSVFTFGRAAHVMILEGTTFDDRYEVSDGPINPRTEKPYGRDTKAFQDWLTEITTDGIEVISTGEFKQLIEMDCAVHSHDFAANLLESGDPEVTIRAHVCGVPCQARIDWVCQDRGYIVDLKTCSELGLRHSDEWPCKFAKDAKIFGYHRQMAFYRMMIRQLTGKDYQVAIIAVEKEAPYEVGVFHFSKSTLDHAEDQIRETLREYREAEDSMNFQGWFQQPITL